MSQVALGGGIAVSSPVCYPVVSVVEIEGGARLWVAVCHGEVARWPPLLAGGGGKAGGGGQGEGKVRGRTRMTTTSLACV